MAAQADDPESLLSFYRDLIALRKEHAALNRGSLTLVGVDPDVLAFFREEGGERLLVALNFSVRKKALDVDGCNTRTVALSNAGRKTVNSGSVIELGPYEALILE